MTDQLNGQCLCGGVKFRLAAPFRDVVVCHCRQCARWTGHAVAMTSVPDDRFEMLAGEHLLSWFKASAAADRGFCKNCGSTLFWKPVGEARISVSAGALDPPTGLKVEKHIYAADKSDYFVIGDHPVQLASDG